MSVKDTFISIWESIPALISSGSSLSAAINLGGLRLFAIVMPAAWTTANITFQVSADNGATWSNLVDQNGTELTAVAGAGQCIVLSPTQFSAFQYLRLRSGTNASPVNQAADRTLQLIVRSV